MHLADFLISCNELPQISAFFSPSTPSSILPLVFPWRPLPRPPHPPAAAHLTEPDTEICAANSLHSNGSVWCHNWRAIDLCLLLQRPEWLMSRASCHNRLRPGLPPHGCSPHSFLSCAICCGSNIAETVLISFLHGDNMGKVLVFYLAANKILYVSNHRCALKPHTSTALHVCRPLIALQSSSNAIQDYIGG